MEEDRKIQFFVPTYEDMKQPAAREELDKKFRKFIETMPDSPQRHRIIDQYKRNSIDYDTAQIANRIRAPYWEQFMDTLKDISNRLTHAKDGDREGVELEQDLLLRLIQVVQLWYPEDPDYTMIGEHKDGR